MCGMLVSRMATRSFSPSSRNRLTLHDLNRFPSDTLFDRIGRAVCKAASLPRKELYESWEVARRSRRFLRGGRVVDIGGGHGLLAHMMLLLDDSSPSALVVDPAVPASASGLSATLVDAWPRLTGRVDYLPQRLDEIALGPHDIVVSCHACGSLTDQVIRRAVAAQASLAVLPCCHDADSCEAGAAAGWMDVSLAIDVMRAVRLEQQGYRVITQAIPEAITPKNRLLMGMPHTQTG